METSGRDGAMMLTKEGEEQLLALGLAKDNNKKKKSITSEISNQKTSHLHRNPSELYFPQSGSEFSSVPFCLFSICSEKIEHD